MVLKLSAVYLYLKNIVQDIDCEQSLFFAKVR